MSMRGINGRTVNVKRLELLEMLKKNKELHQAEYDEALADFKKAMVAELQKQLKLAKAEKLSELHISLYPPKNHADDFQEVIDMMEVSVDEVINLDSESFKAFFKNEWSWSSQFKLLASSYKAALA